MNAAHLSSGPEALSWRSSSSTSGAREAAPGASLCSSGFCEAAGFAADHIPTSRMITENDCFMRGPSHQECASLYACGCSALRLYRLGNGHYTEKFCVT